jgi:hypothetical protein
MLRPAAPLVMRASAPAAATISRNSPHHHDGISASSASYDVHQSRVAHVGSTAVADVVTDLSDSAGIAVAFSLRNPVGAAPPVGAAALAAATAQRTRAVAELLKGVELTWAVPPAAATAAPGGALGATAIGNDTPATSNFTALDRPTSASAASAAPASVAGGGACVVSAEIAFAALAHAADVGTAAAAQSPGRRRIRRGLSVGGAQATPRGGEDESATAAPAAVAAAVDVTPTAPSATSARLAEPLYVPMLGGTSGAHAVPAAQNHPAWRLREQWRQEIAAEAADIDSAIIPCLVVQPPMPPMGVFVAPSVSDAPTLLGASAPAAASTSWRSVGTLPFGAATAAAAATPAMEVSNAAPNVAPSAAVAAMPVSTAPVLPHIALSSAAATTAVVTAKVAVAIPVVDASPPSVSAAVSGNEQAGEEDDASVEARVANALRDLTPWIGPNAAAAIAAMGGAVPFGPSVCGAAEGVSATTGVLAAQVILLDGLGSSVSYLPLSIE